MMRVMLTVVGARRLCLHLHPLLHSPLVHFSAFVFVFFFLAPSTPPFLAVSFPVTLLRSIAIIIIISDGINSANAEMVISSSAAAAAAAEKNLGCG